MVEGNAGPQRVLALRQRRALAKGWQVPTLILDATMEPDLLRHVWPDLELVADIAVAAPHMHIRQVIDRAYSLAMLDSDGTRDAKEARRRRNRLVSRCSLGESRRCNQSGSECGRRPQCEMRTVHRMVPPSK